MFARALGIASLAGCAWACVNAPAPLIFWPSFVGLILAKILWVARAPRISA